MPNKTPPHKAYPRWTEAKYFQFIRSALRKLSVRWPPRGEALKLGRRTVTGKRHRFEHLCTICKKWFPQKEIDIDHIIPAGKLNSHDDLKGFVSRLFCGVGGLRKLCRPCHKAHTKAEKEKP